MKLAQLVPAVLLYFICNVALCQEIYKNKEFGFEAEIPKDWSVYKETPPPSSNYMIIAWGMPKLYSEMEKEEIENSVSITAIKSSSIKDAAELAEKEYKRVSGFAMKVDRTKINSTEDVCFITSSIIKFRSYVSKQYFFYKKGTGYILTFTATPGTYTENEPKFDEFFKSVKFD
ncbi:PsbP-related protein [Sphingobacterium sp. UDSM-2020]|uniref:PsbP-related protein n=1 Tax=Sphingobacterium TaxID=28453 RepID=UPI0019362098|nr:PsbP-related protein [Sphingobacterium sp. UDSM-2020]QQD14719.1 hypothetical protein JAZ75_04065 [Sphingobacterium sp. UDSM-2020]